MPSWLGYDILSFTCLINDNIDFLKGMNAFEEFEAETITFDLKSNNHIITVGFSGAQPASQ